MHKDFPSSHHILDHYSHCFKKLKRGASKHLGKAPHKPVMLLAVIRGIRKKEITE